eukprot:4250943-Prymnesium_polylepis.1
MRAAHPRHGGPGTAAAVASLWACRRRHRPLRRRLDRRRLGRRRLGPRAPAAHPQHPPPRAASGGGSSA